MNILIRNAEVYQSHRLEKNDVLICNERIGKVKREIGDSADRIIDAEGKILLPGFIDIHTHGAAGVDVNHADAEDFEKICRFFAARGTTGWLCSVLTDTREQTLRTIEEYRKWKKLPHAGAELFGIHLEGPFLNPEYKGAMPEKLLRLPDPELIREYQEAADGEIRYMTLSPEMEGAVELIPVFKKMGIQIAIGHSGAGYETAVHAIRNGAAAATHTGNAMRLLHQHEPAIWGAVLEDRDVYCEIICDGLHLHPGTIRFILKMKGTERVIAITDSIMAAGMPDGEYKLGINDIVVRNGDAVLKNGGSRAGSTLTTGKAFRNLMKFTGKSIPELVPLFSENPAKLLDIYDRTGSIDPGKKADFVLTDREGNIELVLVGGKPVGVEKVC